MGGGGGGLRGGVRFARPSRRSTRRTILDSPSSLSNTGEPSPDGTLRTIHSTTPPIELPRLRMLSMRSIISSALAW